MVKEMLDDACGVLAEAAVLRLMVAIRATKTMQRVITERSLNGNP